MKSRLHQAAQTDRARWGFVAVISIWIIAASIIEARASDYRYWDVPVSVTYEQHDPYLIQLVQYAAWSVSQRTGHPVTVAGQAGSAQNGRIHVTVISDAQMWAERDSSDVDAYVRPFVWSDQREVMARAELVIRQSALQSRCAQRVMVHEFMHAWGSFGHSTDPHDVMYASTWWCLFDRYTLSRGDLARLHPQYAVNWCWAELTPDGDLYVPAVAGYSVELKNLDGSSWRLGDVRDGGHCAGAIIDVLVTLPDIRGERERYSAVLSMKGDVLTLVSADGGQVRSGGMQFMRAPDVVDDGRQVVELGVVE